MNDEILKLARDSGLTCYGASKQSSGHHSWHAYTPHLEAFYRAAYNKAIEDAAKVADENAKRDFPWGSENADIYHAQAHWAERIAKSIRSLGMK